MNEVRLRELISQGEGLSIEFKESHTQLNRDVYESVCSFLNRRGGDLILGVRDDGEILGVEPTSSGRMKQDFANAVNNPQKLNPAFYLSLHEIEIAGKTVLHTYVPESSMVHRCNGIIYDRNEDADIDITDNTQLVAALYQRKQSTYSENKIFPHVSINDLKSDLIDRVRKMAGLQQADHP